MTTLPGTPIKPKKDSDPIAVVEPKSTAVIDSKPIPEESPETIPIEPPETVPIEPPSVTPSPDPIPVAEVAAVPTGEVAKRPLIIPKEHIDRLQEDQKTLPPPPSTSSVRIVDSKKVDELKDEQAQAELPAWERRNKPGVLTRMGGQLFGTEKPPDQQEINRMIATIVGQFGGATVGLRLPRAPGTLGLLINPLTGSLIGSGLGTIAGYTAPETTMEVMEYFGVYPPGYREKHGLSPSRLRYEAENELMLDIATGGLFTTMGMAWRYGSRLATGANKAARETAEIAAKKWGIDMIPVQVGKRMIARGFVSVLGRFPWIGTRIRKLGGEAENQLRNAYNDLGNRVGAIIPHNELGELIFKDSTALLNKFNEVFGKYYDEIWDAADKLGVIVRPLETQKIAKEVISELNKKAPALKNWKRNDGVVDAKIRKFIVNKINTLGDAQSLRQVDGLMDQIDQMLKSLKPEQRKFADPLLRIRTAVQKDALTNVVGKDAAEIVARYKDVDKKFSLLMNELFETSVAKRIGVVQKGGLRKSALISEQATRINVDELAKYIIRLDSPKALNELYRLVTPETFDKMVSRVLNDAVDSAKRIHDDGIEGFKPDIFAQYLGLDVRALSARRETIREMLALSGHKITLKDLDSLITVTKAIRSLPLPNASVFLQRKAVIGGLTGAIRGVLPGVAVAAGTSMLAGVWGVAMMIGGGKLASRLISDKNALKPFREIALSEGKKVRNWKAGAQAIRFGLDSLVGDGSITQEMYNELITIVEPTWDAFKEEVILQQGQEKEK